MFRIPFFTPRLFLTPAHIALTVMVPISVQSAFAETAKADIQVIEKPNEIFSGKGIPSDSLGHSGDLYLTITPENDVVLFRKTPKNRWNKFGKFFFAREMDDARQTCPAGQYVVGLEAGGKIICGASISGGHSKTCSGHGTWVNDKCQCQRDWRGSDCEEQIKLSTEDLAPNKDSDNDGSTVPDDCNDQDDDIYPGAPENTDGKDNNCNGIIDEQ